jgi:low affinity Fe/Cu permease
MTARNRLVGIERLQPSHLKALDAWVAEQATPVTRPEAIRAMMVTILHILSKDPGERPAKKAKRK